MKPWHNITITDVVAVLCIIVAGIGLFLHVDPQFGTALLLVAGYYFGKKASTLPPPPPPTGSL